MANPQERRLWFVVASFPDGERECTSGLLTYTQARTLAEAVETVGMKARIDRWDFGMRAAS